jgi:hypothetical protein
LLMKQAIFLFQKNEWKLNKKNCNKLICGASEQLKTKLPGI